MTLPYTPQMQKNLHIGNAKEAMTKVGLSQTAIARELGVSKEAVSGWLKGRNFPRPNKLLQLGRLLQLDFDELVIIEDPFTPKIAFRKMKGTRTKDHHIGRAQEMGRLLRHLVPYLPFDTLAMPPVLKSPNCDHDYLRQVTAKVREDIGLGPTDSVDFTDLINRFGQLQAVIVPVLWGAKNRHENALHIYLPDSETTWVYLNLDTNHHDFKFWMAHELGHCLSPDLDGEKAEDFADAFAGALLFPHELAERAHAAICFQQSVASRVSEIFNLAEQHVISPYTVLKQVEEYAAVTGKPGVNPGKRFGAAVTNFNKSYMNLSGAMFVGSLDEQGRPNARDYISKSEGDFGTPFFKLLKKYLIDYEIGPGYVETVLDASPLDAQSIHAELTDGPGKNPC